MEIFEVLLKGKKKIEVLLEKKSPKDAFAYIIGSRGGALKM